MALSTGTKVGITIAVVVGGVGYVVYTTISSDSALEYFKHVEEAVGQYQQLKSERLQVHGNIVAGSILKRAGGLDYKFALHRQKRWLDVSYKGIVPDNFKDCAELVVKGRFVDERHFHADEISAKCPSKYDGKRDSGCGDELKAAVSAHRDKEQGG